MMTAIISLSKQVFHTRSLSHNQSLFTTKTADLLRYGRSGFRMPATVDRAGWRGARLPRKKVNVISIYNAFRIRYSNIFPRNVIGVCFVVPCAINSDVTLCWVIKEEIKMGVFLELFFVTILVSCAFGQEPAECFGAGSVAGAAIGAFLAALLLVVAAYYLRKLYWKSRKGKWRTSVGCCLII